MAKPLSEKLCDVCGVDTVKVVSDGELTCLDCGATCPECGEPARWELGGNNRVAIVCDEHGGFI